MISNVICRVVFGKKWEQIIEKKRGRNIYKILYKSNVKFLLDWISFIMTNDDVDL